MQLRHLRRSLALVLAVAAAGTASAADGRLVDAAKRGDLAALRAALAGHVDVNAPAADGTTALHWAVHRADLDATRLLIGAGADVNAASRYGVRPLSLASVNGRAPIVEALLAAGADANASMAEGETALMTAARTGDVATIAALLEYGADVDATEGWRGQTALMWAAAENNAAAVGALVEAGADVAARSKAGFTPLLYAARAGSIEAARALLAAGSDVNETLPNGVAPLVLAIINAKYEQASQLLEHGADPNASGAGWTALHQVVWTRRPNVGHNNPEPVHADNTDSLDLVRQLLAHGASLEARVAKEPRTGLNSFRRIGATPFLLAAKAVDVPLMRLLLDAGADPWRTNLDGTTAMMVAAGVGMYAAGEDAGTPEESLEAVRLLYGLGFDVTSVDRNGDTALHGAAFRGANEVVKLLVQEGADLDAVNNKGWTPLRVADGVFINATLKSQPKTAAFIRQLMADRSAGLQKQDNR